MRWGKGSLSVLGTFHGCPQHLGVFLLSTVLQIFFAAPSQLGLKLSPRRHRSLCCGSAQSMDEVIFLYWPTSDPDPSCCWMEWCQRRFSRSG